jgi:membrane protease YdiL (CAAX protease family)
MRARTATSRSATGRTSERALLASSGVNVSSAIEPHRREERTRLAAWLALIAFFIAVQYVGRASGAEESDPLYKWSFAIGTVIQEALFLGIVLAIAGFSRERLALRIPERKARAAGLAIATIFIIQAFELLYAALAHPGNEQGLTPTQWQPSHAAQYVVNSILVCTLVPFTEELTFRGLGYHLLRPWGAWFAVVATGVLFGLSHGLLVSLPVLVIFGCGVGWLRMKTGSVVPGMFVHGTFNLIALIAAVTLQR